MLYCTEISKVGKCHSDNVISSEATKTHKPKARISHFKTLPVSSFALAFPVYIRLVVNNDYFASKPCTSIQCVRLDLSKTKFGVVADKPLRSCDLDVSIQILGWIVWINYFDTRHTTVFDQFDCFSIGFMHYHQWSKSRCSVRLASYT